MNPPESPTPQKTAPTVSASDAEVLRNLDMSAPAIRSAGPAARRIRELLQELEVVRPQWKVERIRREALEAELTALKTREGELVAENEKLALILQAHRRNGRKLYTAEQAGRVMAEAAEQEQERLKDHSELKLLREEVASLESQLAASRNAAADGLLREALEYLEEMPAMLDVVADIDPGEPNGPCLPNRAHTLREPLAQFLPRLRAAMRPSTGAGTDKLQLPPGAPGYGWVARGDGSQEYVGTPPVASANEGLVPTVAQLCADLKKFIDEASDKGMSVGLLLDVWDRLEILDRQNTHIRLDAVDEHATQELRHKAELSAALTAPREDALAAEVKRLKADLDAATKGLWSEWELERANYKAKELGGLFEHANAELNRHLIEQNVKFRTRLKAVETTAGECVEVLQRIERWKGEFPPSHRYWDGGSGEMMSYGAAFGSNGERDFMRGLARDVLTKATRLLAQDSAPRGEGEGRT